MVTCTSVHSAPRPFRTVSSLSQHLSSAAHDPAACVIDAEKAWNGYKYCCCLCDRELNSIRALEQHLASPAHDDREFWCHGCRLEFKLISALIQHLDNGNCGGGSKASNKVFRYIAAPEYSRRA
ncbi:hypothetical protein BC937DRAFT_90312 [Endogone sp. FLAS-F59071]|nr:hypothetical protein BC937DRAFT_90312 [Endogone sp. FLAS-F59071]|eukprot:RUS17164.1 hypothetical protein BC937DRAFT_90312 [Endogone sp. FLAS-F59071]